MFTRRLLSVSALVALAALAGGCQGGCTPKPRPDPQPIPVPPGPGPEPTPAPSATVTGFVIVEDTSAAGQARGMFLGSSKVTAFLKNSGLKHAIVSTAAVGPDGAAVGGIVGGLIADAKAKGLPHLYQLDDSGKTVKDQVLALDPDLFVAAFATPHKRSLGNITPPAGVKGKWRVFGTTPNTKVIPRADWKELDLEAYLPPVKDQDGIGACNAFATVTATEASREVAGLSYVKLSPGWLYGRINGGSDQGSFLEDGLAWMTDHGTCTSATVGDLSWRSNPSKASTEAKSYRVVEAYVCPTFDHLASALQQGFFIVEGLLWFDNFNPDAEGWLPAVGRGNYGGHALCGYGLARRGGAWGVKTRNSWGVTWGNGGNCVIPESLFGGPVGGWWAVRSVTRTPEPFPPGSTARRVRLGLAPDLEYQLAP